MEQHLRPENGDGSFGVWTGASTQGNCDGGYLGAYTAEGQGEEAHPGLPHLCREADAPSGAQGQSPARPEAGGMGGGAHLCSSHIVRKDEENENQSGSSDFTRYHRRARWVVRCHRGVAVGLARGFRFRWFVLTESDEAIALGLEFGREFHRFLVWLRYSCSDFQYTIVEHRQGKPSKVSGSQRRNWHVLSYGSDRLPIGKIERYWQSHFKSKVTGMAEVKDIRKAVNYLGGYLSGESKFVRAWSSKGWVFDGWLSVSREWKRQYGVYPEEDGLVALALLSPAERAETDVVMITQLEKERRLACQGRAKRVVKRCKAPLTGGVSVAENVSQGEHKGSPQCPGEPLRLDLRAEGTVLRLAACQRCPTRSRGKKGRKSGL